MTQVPKEPEIDDIGSVKGGIDPDFFLMPSSSQSPMIQKPSRQMFSETKSTILGKRPRSDWLFNMIKENGEQISELEKE